MKLYTKKEWLESEYVIKGRRLDDIAVQFDKDRSTIALWVKKFGLKRPRIMPVRSAKRYAVNDHYFETIDTERKAYWLGFLAADGCVQNSKGKRILTVELQSGDRDHLETLKSDLGYTGPIYYDRVREKFGKITRSDLLQVTSWRVAAHLEGHGLPPRKSKILKPPAIEEDLVRHWIRGYFDGDGSVSIVQTTRNICGSFFGTKQVTEWIASHLQASYCTKAFAYEVVAKNGWQLCFNGNGVAARIASYLYRDATIYLQRKHAKFHER